MKQFLSCTNSCSFPQDKTCYSLRVVQDNVVSCGPTLQREIERVKVYHQILRPCSLINIRSGIVEGFLPIE